MRHIGRSLPDVLGEHLRQVERLPGERGDVELRLALPRELHPDHEYRICCRGNSYAALFPRDCACER